MVVVDEEVCLCVWVSREFWEFLFERVLVRKKMKKKTGGVLFAKDRTTFF